jgi:hypothetical protein
VLSSLTSSPSGSGVVNSFFTDATPQGEIALAQVRGVQLTQGRKPSFELKTAAGRTYLLAADSPDAARRWVDKLRDAIASLADHTTGDGEDKKSRYKLLSGERLLTKQENVLIAHHHSLTEGRWGQLHMTPYRFILLTKVGPHDLVGDGISVC